jgi:hypothetical protein
LARIAGLIEIARPFRPETGIEPLAQELCEAWRPATCGNRNYQIAPAHQGRHMEVAEGRFILDIDEHPSQTRPICEKLGIGLCQAGYKKQLQAPKLVFGSDEKG